MAILTGHNHYVMSAQFHPTKDYIVSASMDQTVRVWDISGLAKKNKAGPGTVMPPSLDDPFGRSSPQADGFTISKVTVKHILEGQTRCQLGHILPYATIGHLWYSDDRQVNLWRMNGKLLDIK